MKFIYPAVFEKIETNTVRGYFPDLEDCIVEAPSLDEALEKAQEAAYDWIYVELLDEGLLPPVSEESDLELPADAQVRNILVNIRMTDGWDE